MAQKRIETIVQVSSINLNNLHNRKLVIMVASLKNGQNIFLVFKTLTIK